MAVFNEFHKELDGRRRLPGQGSGPQCKTHINVVSAWSGDLTVKIEKISKPSVPSGPVFGTPFTAYTYTFGGATSNIGDPLEYRITWGDGVITGWITPDSTGKVILTKSWSDGGLFNVTVQARCALHTSIVSEVSDPLEVSIETITAPNKPTLAGSPPPPSLQCECGFYLRGGRISFEYRPCY